MQLHQSKQSSNNNMTTCDDESNDGITTSYVHPPSHIMISNSLGSAAAGIVSRLFTHPIDTAKSRLQAQFNATSPTYYKNTADVILRTFRTEGVRGLYRGFGAILVGGTPGTVTYLCTYELAKDWLSHIQQQQQQQADNKKNSNGGNFVVHFCSGMIAETIACIVYVPVDVIKERLQVQHNTVPSGGTSYRGSYDALKQIARTEGVSGVYKGYAATLASFGPFSALYFVFYERLKWESRLYLYPRDERREARDLPFPWLVLCSASAGAMASWLTSPLDMAKLRLQVQRGQKYREASKSGGQQQHLAAQNTRGYRGVVDCLKMAYRDGGVNGLFRGAMARVYFFAPATAITMSCYETCRSFAAQHLS